MPSTLPTEKKFNFLIGRSSGKSASSIIASHKPSKALIYDPILQPTINSSQMPNLPKTSSSTGSSFLRNSRAVSSNQLPTLRPTTFPSSTPTHQPSKSVTSFTISLEVPENELFNVTKTEALESAISNALSDPNCKFEYFNVTSVEISDQSLSAGSDFLIVEVNIIGDLDTEEKKPVTEYSLSNCIKTNIKDIKYEYNLSMGYIDTDGGNNVSPVDNAGTWFHSTPIIISASVVGFITVLVLVAYGMFFVQKRKRRRREILHDIHQMYDEKDFQEDDDSNNFSYASEHNEDIHNELGDIKQILTMVLNGSNENGPALNREDLSQMSYSTSETDRDWIKSGVNTNTISTSIELQPAGFVRKMQTVEDPPSFKTRSVSTHRMHSEGLTFQPIVNTPSSSDKDKNGERQTQDSIPDSKIVIESKRSFFDESKNRGIELDDDEDYENVVTNFAKRMMYAFNPASSPKEKQSNSPDEKSHSHLSSI